MKNASAEYPAHFLSLFSVGAGRLKNLWLYALAKLLLPDNSALAVINDNLRDAQPA